jgi:hypothetical protein
MDDRPTLTDLAIQHQTDKWGSHYYTPHYEHHFKHLRDEPINLLKIGVGGYIQKGANREKSNYGRIRGIRHAARPLDVLKAGVKWLWDWKRLI